MLYALILVLLTIVIGVCYIKKMTKKENLPLTCEQRNNLSHQDIIERLKAGNRAFVAGTVSHINTPQRVKLSSRDQFPEAVILSCHDSRVVVEDIFRCGVGDVCVTRVAGNVSSVEVLASLEHACSMMGAKVVVVLGHTDCGAIVSAIDKKQLGNLTAVLKRIEPSIESVRSSFVGIPSSNNPAFVDMVCRANIKHTISDIRKNSSILHQKELEGEVAIVGAIYDMVSGSVEFAIEEF